MLLRLYLIIGSLWLLATPCMAAGWNGIVPLKTTRAEVIAILGEPKHYLKWNDPYHSEGTGPEYFTYDGDRVLIEWARSDCWDGKLPIDEKRVTSDSLVWRLKIFPKDPTAGKYETSVRDMLAKSNKQDCVPPNRGLCLVGDTEMSYNRTELGIVMISFGFPMDDEFRSWSKVMFRTRCSQKDYKPQLVNRKDKLFPQGFSEVL